MGVDLSLLTATNLPWPISPHACVQVGLVVAAGPLATSDPAARCTGVATQAGERDLFVPPGARAAWSAAADAVLRHVLAARREADSAPLFAGEVARAS